MLLALRLWPEPHGGQSVRTWEVLVNGAPVTPAGRNGFGEQFALCSVPGVRGEVAIVASGIVETEDRAGIVTGLTARPNPAIYLKVTNRTRADKSVRELVPAPAPGADLLSWLHGLNSAVFGRLAYISGSTHADTTAIDALKEGCGVCQDHAHLFIAAARAHGVPARYVCGYMLADGLHGDLHETHAWVEAHVDGLGWIAFDPSSGICSTPRYVRLSTGLDSFDAAPIRGHATGGTGTGVLADVRIASSAGWGGEEGIEEARVRAAQQQQSQ